MHSDVQPDEHKSTTQKIADSVSYDKDDYKHEHEAERAHREVEPAYEHQHELDRAREHEHHEPNVLDNVMNTTKNVLGMDQGHEHEVHNH